MTGIRGSILPDERRRMNAQRLRQHGSVSVSALEVEFGISPMTARRDLDELERRGLARRTHGGAVLPGLSSHEDSFLQRLEVEVDAKERLAEAVLGLLEPGEAIFVDSSTTAFFAARRIVRENLQCTCSPTPSRSWTCCARSMPRRSSSSARAGRCASSPARSSARSPCARSRRTSPTT